MAGVAEIHMEGLHVDATDKQSDKHVVAVGVADTVVDTAQCLVHRKSETSHETERGTGDGHHQRSRNPFAGHIADGEIELVTFDGEVVQVAAHLFGGVQHRIELRREIGAQHPHLDIARHVEFRLHALIGRCGGLQLLNVVGNGVLHIDETVVQTEHLVLAGDFGQFCLEVALGHVQRGDRQLGDGARHAAYHTMAH